MSGQVALLVISAAYLLGSLPTAYLVARIFLGVDIRTIGSGNVGGSNLKDSLGVWATIAVGAVDLLKGAVAVWAVQELGGGLGTAAAAGLAAVLGHDWSVWLRFQGGRGAATTMGVLLVLFPQATLLILLSMGVGSLVGVTAVAHLAAVLAVPFLAGALGEPREVIAWSFAAAVIMMVKRLEANVRFGTPPAERSRVLAARLLLDRDHLAKAVGPAGGEDGQGNRPAGCA